MKCPRCGAEVPAGAKACGRCGAQFVAGQYCPHCGKVIPSGSQKCPKCGKPIAQVVGMAIPGSGAKKPLTKCWWFWALCVLLILGIIYNIGNTIKHQKSSSEHPTPSPAAVVATPSPTPTAKPTITPSPTATPQTVSYTYDDLQLLFISLGKNTSIDMIESAIEESSLFYSTAEYNKGDGGKSLHYVIAYTKESAAQKYADSGDHLNISFDVDNENCIMYAEYVNSKNVGYSALFYNYGIWYDLQEEEPGQYTGYYINDVFSHNDGLVITYSNGNTKSTNYFPCESSEIAINKIIDLLNSET